MTDETRETLTKLADIEARRAAYEASNIVAVVSEHGWALGPDPWNSDAYWSAKRAGHHANIAAALRDVLTPRTCGTCQWAQSGTCVNPDSMHDVMMAMDPDDGCIKGWQAREGEGGTR